MKHPTFNFKAFAHSASPAVWVLLSLFLFMLLIPVETQAQTGEYVIKEKKGKFGLKYDNSTLLPVEYDSIKVLYRGGVNQYWFAIEKDMKWGVVECQHGMWEKPTCKEVVPCEYDGISLAGGLKPEEYLPFTMLFLVKKNNLYGIITPIDDIDAIDDKIWPLVPVQFDKVDYFTSKTNYYPVVKDGLYGIAGYGKLVVPCKYKAEDIMKSHLLSTVEREQLGIFDYDFFKYRADGKYGLLYGGQEILQNTLDSISFVGGNSRWIYLAAGKECGILCFNDSTFSWLVPSGQQKITWGSDTGLWLITVTDANGKSTYIDSEGKPFSLPGWAQWRRVEDKEIDGYDNVSQSVNNGYHLYWAAKNSSDKYFTHIVNEKGIPVVNVRTTKIVEMFTVDVMMVSRNGRIGLVDVKTGKVLAPCAHDGVRLCGPVDGVMRYCMYNNTPTGKTYSVYQNGKLLAKATYNRSQIRARNAFMLNWMGGY